MKSSVDVKLSATFSAPLGKAASHPLPASLGDHTKESLGTGPASEASSTSATASISGSISGATPSNVASPLHSVHFPKHVAIIMDGNGRWAKQQGFHRSIGHMRGTSKVKETIREADRLGISVLTLFCFSTENWSRPADEISVLMELLRDYLLQERQELIDNNIKLQTLGQTDRLPVEIREILLSTIQATENNSGMILNFCISYGARAEIVRAFQLINQDIAAGKLQASMVNEKTLSRYLYTQELPDPDLIIRTSGEFRVSNFLLWQSAYSEFYITDTLWPDFEPQHLRAALEAYRGRNRRFGLSDEV